MINLNFSSKGTFFQSFRQLFLGNVFSQLIAIAFSPILTRIFDPASFGIYALFISIITILGAFISMRLEGAVVLAKTNRIAVDVFTLGISFLAFWFCIFQILIYFANQLLSIETLNLLANYSYFIPITAVLIGLMLLIDGWLNKKGKFLFISNLQILHATSTAICSITIGLYYASINGLIIGAFAAFLLTSIIGLMVCGNEFWSNLRFPTIKSLKKTLKDFKNFPLYSTPANLCGVFSVQSFYIFAGIIYGEVILGFLYLLNRIVSIPSSTISMNVGKVYFKYLSDNRPKKTYKNSILLLLAMLALSAVISIILYIFLFSYIGRIFGSEWSDAENYLVYFIFLGAVNFIYSPFSFIYLYLGIQKYELIWQFSTLFTSLLIYAITFFFKLSIDAFLILFVGKQACLNILSNIYVLYRLKEKKS